MNERKRLPAFTKDGVLPVGVYELTPDEFRTSKFVRGPRNRSADWDVAHRAMLVENALLLIGQLWQAGIEHVYLDGSFVEAKDRPNDIDGYFECEEADFLSGRLKDRLNQLSPEKIWDWSTRVKVPNNKKPQLRMWERYRVELFPNYGQPTGIRDEFGNELSFPAAFRRSRRGFQKGIIKIVPSHDSNRP